MGDFVGGTLQYLRRHPIERVTIAGGSGEDRQARRRPPDPHSSRATVDLPGLTALLAEQGATGDLLDHARAAASANEVLRWLRASASLADDVARNARRVALEQLDGVCGLEVMAFDRDGGLVGRAGGW